MGKGNAGAMMIVSKMKGWDPTVIQPGNGSPAESIAGWDQNLFDNPIGRFSSNIPGGPPKLEGTEESPLAQKDDWSTNLQSEPKVRRGTKNANPFPGF